MNIIIYDFGTSSLKTCLFNVDNGRIALEASSNASYGLYVLENGGGDTTFVNIGAGCTTPGDEIYGLPGSKRVNDCMGK